MYGLDIILGRNPMKEDKNETQNRRAFLKTVGIATAGLAATVPANAQSKASTDEPAFAPEDSSDNEVGILLHKGQRVTDTDNDSYVPVYSKPSFSSNYKGAATGGANPPYGTTVSKERRDAAHNATFIKVDWDAGGDPTGWCPRGDLAPVNV